MISATSKGYLVQGLASQEAADEVEALLSAGNVVPTAAPAAQPTYTPGADLVGVDGTGNSAAPVAATEARLDAADAQIQSLISKVNALRSALIAAGVLV